MYLSPEQQITDNVTAY